MTGFKSILVQSDRREELAPVLERAVDVARAHNATLMIVDVVPQFSLAARTFVPEIDRLRDELSAEKSAWLKETADRLRGEGIQADARLLNGPSSMAIIREVVQNGHDLVVRSAKGSGSRRTGFFGTTSTRLLRKCPCPVLLLKRGRELAGKMIVASVDATAVDDEHAALNDRILEIARSEAARNGASSPVDVVHAWSVYGENLLRDRMASDAFNEVVDKASRHAERKMNELIARSGLGPNDCRIHLLHGDARDLIPEFTRQNDVDLLVMGTVGRSGISGLLMGNTAEIILDRINCSVLTIKPEGFVPPVDVGS